MEKKTPKIKVMWLSPEGETKFEILPSLEAADDFCTNLEAEGIQVYSVSFVGF